VSLDPIRTTEAIRNSYLRYLETTFPIQDTELAKQFRQQLREPDRFVKGPILESTPPFRLGKSIGDLIENNILSSGFKDLCNEYLPLDRQLYEHQEKAICKLVAEGRNIVVATGTGSGKTEAFLIPIINYLLQEREKGDLCSGVRALLLYPMNALANDQMKRLRRILEHFPDITFGRYTGETKETKRVAEDHFSKNFPDEPRIENEILSREEMRNNPPHILLTNYAMLEYLLLRPKDCEFFDGEKAKYWHFLVLDEAHTYDGAKGIEAAMLIRRLKDRIVKSQPGKLQCIATSATLGRGREDFLRVSQFATQLFGERFEWVDEDPRKQDVVEASRISEMGYIWDKPDPTLYELWAKQLDELNPSSIDNLIKIGIKKGIPEKVLKNAENKARQIESLEESIKRFLFEVLNGDGNLRLLQRLLEENPRFLSEVSKGVFSSLTDSDAQQALKSLVDLAVQAKSDEESQSLLPARYHLFVRALEGAYLSLVPEKRIFLDRREYIKQNDHEYPVFEMATCRRCGHIYLVGETKKRNGKLVLGQTKEISEENREDAEFYLLWGQDLPQSVQENEDELIESDDEAAEISQELYILCSSCGAIEQKGLLTPLCSCGDSKRYQQTLQKVPSKDRKVKHCPACGARGPNLVGRFLTGQDAPVSVLATALYQRIPPKKSRENDEDLENSNIGRQLLIFSDSRQDAAFFACYLDRTYQQILRRCLILYALKKYRDEAIANRWRIQDVVEPIRREAEPLQIFPDRLSLQEQKNEVWKWLLLELLAYDRRNSLEGLGLLGFALVKPKNWQAPPPLLQKPWELTDEETWMLYQILLDSFRIQGAIAFPDSVSPKDDDFSPRNHEFYFRENGSAPKKHIFSWASPSKNRLNRRLDFLLKLSKRLPETGVSMEDCKQILINIWRENLFKSSSYWKDYFVDSPVQGEGRPYRLRYNFWELRPGIIDPSIQWYQCDICGNLSLHNLRGICPTYRCQGSLNLSSPDTVFKNNHYRRLYLELKPMRLVAKEHTAQLTSEAAADRQDDFMRGEVNVLSCSTTFELGVDVGELETVLMRNVPPSATNYIQRAGRAGRRTDSTAFALTFAQRRSHDLTHFREPKRMVSGKIRSPYFEICNEKIVRRHIHAVAIAQFWQQHQEFFGERGKVDNFFFPSETGGPEKFKEFLNQYPRTLQHALRRIVPEPLQLRLGIDSWLWLEELIGQRGVLQKAAEEIREDVKALESIKTELIQKNKPSDYILRLINTLKNRSVIDFLSSRNVLPKYGFPVDVVELQLLHHGEEAEGLELNRDLRIALSEYAPKSEVVAGGRIWVSHGLKRLPNREWPRYQYAVCQKCQCYQRVLVDTGRSLQECTICSFSLEGHRVKGTFIIPEFGFVTSNGPPGRPGESRPERTYTTRVFFSGESSSEEDPCELTLGTIKFVAAAARDGKMAVLNRVGFKICNLCGFGLRSNEKAPNPHKTPLGKDCRGTLTYTDLGHEFRSDILDLKIKDYSNPNRTFWLSLLYALLEGASESLEINRDDLDGCLYPYAGDPTKSAIILFDDVPGGAGHVKRLASPYMLKRLLEKTKDKVQGNCGCGEETSCYGCLRNYRNQFCHEELKRGMIKESLEGLL
jgi:ATP-dependent helicase YprA (DUF1998 family)